MRKPKQRPITTAHIWNLFEMMARSRWIKYDEIKHSIMATDSDPLIQLWRLKAFYQGNKIYTICFVTNQWKRVDAIIENYTV